MWSSVTTFSATSTAFRSGSRSIDVLSRIWPVSGARRASIGIGCGQTVGCETQWWPMETHAKPIDDAARKTDPRAIAAEHFTLSVMFVPPGQGNAAHTHEVEE